MRTPVDLRARRVPGLEDGFDGASQLLARVLREAAAGRLLVDRFEARDELREVVRGQVDVLLGAALLLQLRELLLEPVAVDPVDRLAVHLDQAPVGVVGEAAVAGALCQTLDRLAVEPDVQDRVHHPRHRDRRARAHRDEQRVVPVAEPLARALLERLDVLLDLVDEPFGQLPARAHVVAARLGRDRETRGHGDAELGHLRQPDPLAAQKLAPAVGWLVEVEHVGHLCGNLMRAWPSSRSSRWAAAAHPLPCSARCSHWPAASGPGVLYVGTASAEDPRNALIMYELARGQADVTPLRVLPLAAGRPARARARPGRDLRRRRQHREHARDLARRTASTGSCARPGSRGSCSPAAVPG